MTPNEDMKILFTSTSMGLGGADKQILLLAEKYIEQGNNIKIISLTPIGPMGDQARELGAEVVSFDFSKGPGDIWRIFQFIQEIRAFDPDVVHAQMYYANILTRIVRDIAEVDSLICTVQNTYESNPTDGKLDEVSLVERLYRLTKSRDDLTTFVSKRAMERHVDVGAVSSDKSVMIPNGVNTDEFSTSKEARDNVRNEFNVSEKFIWISVGRLWKQKDYTTLLKSFDKLNPENAELWIVGKGPLMNDLVELRNELGLTSSVQFIGPLHPNRIPAFMNAADGFVLSSWWEGFGLVVTEAMATELPVVATDCGGPKDIIEPGISGFLTPRSSPDKLANRLEEVMQMDPEARAKIGRQARQRVEDEFSIRELSKKWIETYRSI